MPDPTPSSRTAGTVALVLGVIALVGYGVLGASPESPDLPTERLLLAAVLVVAGAALRQGRGPSWGQFVVGLLAGLVATDLILRLLG
ncbi:hypothetical protein [Rubrivirga sp. IMCC45206]|uniref:hypothetical protein n=1 Tax=Rubrivirga sp. IMCC45206 TaxID=3391614 RepID=UPI00398FC8A5